MAGMSYFAVRDMRIARNPETETERLARARLDPPGRVWGIRHPQGTGLRERVSVHITGQPFDSRYSAGLERDTLNSDCEYCDPGAQHTLVYRDTPPWRDE